LNEGALQIDQGRVPLVAIRRQQMHMEFVRRTSAEPISGTAMQPQRQPIRHDRQGAAVSIAQPLHGDHDRMRQIEFFERRIGCRENLADIAPARRADPEIEAVAERPVRRAREAFAA